MDDVGILDQKLQETLKTLDNVEKSIVFELEKQEASFFQAISTIDCLSGQISVLLATFEGTAEKLNNINTEHMDNTTKLYAIVSHHELLLEARTLLDQCTDVLRSRQVIQNLLDTHEFGDATRILQEKLDIIKCNLLEISPFTTLYQELGEMKTALDKLTEARRFSGDL